MSKKLIITIDVKNWDKIYEFITKYFKTKGLSKKNIFGLLISSEEIFSNIIRHSQAESDDDIDLSTDFDPLENTASVVFKYGGVEFNPLSRELPDICLPLHKRKLGGLGLLIVKKFADNVTYTYSSGKNILKISKKMTEF